MMRVFELCGTVSKTRAIACVMLISALYVLLGTHD